MKNKKMKSFVSTFSAFAIALIINSIGFAQIPVSSTDTSIAKREDEKSKSRPATDRQIVEARIEMIEDENCDSCENPLPAPGMAFPKFAFLGLPFGFLAAGLLANQNNSQAPTQGAVISAMSVN